MPSKFAKVCDLSRLDCTPRREQDQGQAVCALITFLSIVLSDRADIKQYIGL